MITRATSGSFLAAAGILGSLIFTSATPANAAVDARISLSLFVKDVDEEGTWSNGDEVFIDVIHNGGTQRYAPISGTIDVNESDEGKQVNIPSSNLLRFPVGQKVTIQVWEEDTAGNDLLAEARDVVVGCNSPFMGLTKAEDVKYYNYWFNGSFYC
ncbi:hypothetical protein [Streptosporangium sp. CA-115845]|uniref:hypothetical protein n=1 Tax=Streptosporangium sp. CA-115845 TaxID=3240071 RepID=UPI003D9466E8